MQVKNCLASVPEYTRIVWRPGSRDPLGEAYSAPQTHMLNVWGVNGEEKRKGKERVKRKGGESK